MHRIVRHFEVDSSRLAKDVTEALDRLPRGATSISDFSTHVETAVERGWVYSGADVRRHARAHRAPDGRHPEDAVAAQCADGDLAAFRGGEARHADRRLREDRQRVARGPLGASDKLALAAPGEASEAMAPAQMGKQEALKRFATNLTERARNGQLDPVSGRDEEIRQIVDILMRRRQNNPILTGEAGVGKTAVVEGFAARIAARRRPAAAEERARLHARHRPAAGRRQHEGGVREPAAPGDRRGAGLARSRSSCSWTKRTR